MEREEAIERIKTRFDKWALDDEDMKAIQTLIPELAESEDERIIDGFCTLLDGISRKGGLTLNKVPLLKCYAYLEKQKEQKPAEWSEEDEEMIDYAYGLCYAAHEMTHSAQDANKATKCMSWLKSRLSQPHKEIYQAAKHDLAIRFMNYLDENRPEGKMSLSNGECEDIDKAFKENDWAKIVRYYEKYRPSWKPSEEQMKALNSASTNFASSTAILRTLYYDLKKLM